MFSVDTDEIEFGNLLIPDSSFSKVTITNNSSSEIFINRVFNHNPIFSITDDLPISILAGSSSELEIKFKPDTIGVYEDVMTFCWDINSDTLIQRIACQVNLHGSSHGYESVDEFNKAGFNVYPSPFKDVFTVESTLESIDELLVYDMSGKEVYRKENIQSAKTNCKLELKPGVYVLNIKLVNEMTYSGKIIKE